MKEEEITIWQCDSRLFSGKMFHKIKTNYKGKSINTERSLWKLKLRLIYNILIK